MEKKSRIIVLRLTEREYEEVETLAKAQSVGYGAFVRKIICEKISNQRVKPMYKKDMRQERNKNCHFKLTEAEERRIKELSRISGMSASSILRSMIMRTEPPKMLSTDDKQVVIQLKHIGNNLNQIAAVANTTKSIDEIYLRENIADLQDVLYRIRGIYGV